MYYKHGPLKSVKVAGVQTIDYTYTAQGLLKAINNPDNLGSGANADIFAEQLEYFSGDYVSTGSTIATISGTGTDNFNGLPKAQVWKTIKPSSYTAADKDEINAYTYSYDQRYQLTGSVWGNINAANVYTASSKYKEGDIDYDANGNMLNLKRYNATGGVSHDFLGTNPPFVNGYNYTANTNMLTSITGYASYYYNSIGQMTTETLTGKQARTMKYNVNGVVTEVKEGANRLLENVYDAQGKRIIKYEYNAADQLFQTEYSVRDASGNILAVYRKGSDAIEIAEMPIYGSSRLGTKYGTGPTAYTTYDLKDHLGNVRARINTSHTPEAFTDYYPYGLAIADRTISPVRQAYQGDFSEKDNTGYNHFDAREYNSITGRWNSLDEVHRFPSRYVGMGNNPALFADADGRDIIILYDQHGFRFPQNRGWSELYNSHHGAALIGFDKGKMRPDGTIGKGWVYYSKGPNEEGGSLFDAPSNNFIINFETLDKAAMGYAHEYEYGILIPTSSYEDAYMNAAAKKSAESNYKLLSASCIDVPSQALKSIGYDPGYSPDGNRSMPVQVNERFENMYLNNIINGAVMYKLGGGLGKTFSEKEHIPMFQKLPE